MLESNKTDLTWCSIFSLTMSENDSGNMMNRRQLIASVGCTYALGTSVSSAEETKPMSKKEVQKILSEQYGEQAAKIGSKIIVSEWIKKEKRGKHYKQYYEVVTGRLLSNPHTKQIARDVKNRTAEIKKSEQQRDETSISELNKATSSGTIQLEYDITSTDQTGVGIPQANIINVDNDPVGPPDKAKLLSEVTFYGTATATARIYKTFQPDQTGTYKFTSRFFRKGKAEASGSARTSIYISAIDSEELEPIDEPIGFVNGTKVSSASFEMKSGEIYEVGIEFQTNATNAGSASLGDFKTNGRRFEPSPEFSGINPPEEPTIPELDWEFFG